MSATQGQRSAAQRRCIACRVGLSGAWPAWAISWIDWRPLITSTLNLVLNSGLGINRLLNSFGKRSANGGIPTQGRCLNEEANEGTGQKSQVS